MSEPFDRSIADRAILSRDDTKVALDPAMQDAPTRSEPATLGGVDVARRLGVDDAEGYELILDGRPACRKG